MYTTILSANDLRIIVNTVGLDKLMDITIQRLTETIQQYDSGKTIIPARGGFKYSHPHLGLIEWMPGMQVGKDVTIKVVGYHPESGKINGLPTILSTQSLYSVSDGHLISLMDASFVTALRTGAASAIASKVLAKPDASTIGLIGCGAQAVSQLHALTRLFPVKKVFLFDIDNQAMASFCSRISCLKLEHLSIQSGPIENWVNSVDILVTATSVGIGEGPVFQDVDLAEHIHINAIGSDFPGKFEIPKSVLARALVCPDFPEQAAVEGECQHIMPEDVGPDLQTLVNQTDQYVQAQQRCTVFDSTGWALEDIVTMAMFSEYAAELKLGHQLQLETISTDYLNPYAFIQQNIDNK